MRTFFKIILGIVLGTIVGWILLYGLFIALTAWDNRASGQTPRMSCAATTLHTPSLTEMYRDGSYRNINTVVAAEVVAERDLSDRPNPEDDIDYTNSENLPEWHNIPRSEYYKRVKVRMAIVSQPAIPIYHRPDHARWQRIVVSVVIDTSRDARIYYSEPEFLWAIRNPADITQWVVWLNGTDYIILTGTQTGNFVGCTHR